MKAVLPASDTEGEGHATAAVDPEAQKLPAGQTALVPLDVHRFPAGHTTEAELPASQNVPLGQATKEVELETHTVPVGQTS